MTQQEVHDSVLAFLRKNIVFDETKIIPDDQSFLESGILDSTGILELIGHIEGECKVKFLDEELIADNFDSLTRVSRFVVDKLSRSKGG